MSSRAKELADAHAEWFKELLDNLHVADTEADRDALVWVYRTAFEHGYKHGQEDNSQKQPIPKEQLEEFVIRFEPFGR